jgi:hypothetical protein
VPRRRRGILGDLLDRESAALKRFLRRQGAVPGEVYAQPRYREQLGLKRRGDEAPEQASGDGMNFAVLRKTGINWIPLPLLVLLASEFDCVMETRHFVVLARRSLGLPAIRSVLFERYIAPLAERTEHFTRPGLFRQSIDETAKTPPRRRPRNAPVDAARLGQDIGDTAAVVTTYDRPEALARSLPGIAALGLPVVVVDDGSAPENRDENERTARAHGAWFIALPDNRGVAAALNIGLDFWLADKRIRWISYFQDDVEVDPGLVAAMRRYQDAERQPLLTGFDSGEHAAITRIVDDGYELKFKETTSGQHLHAHRSYWRDVMPVPTSYLGAPKAGQGGSHFDFWVTATAPKSLAARQQNLLCVTGFVRHFAWLAHDSTWGNSTLRTRPDAEEA